MFHVSLLHGTMQSRGDHAWAMVIIWQVTQIRAKGIGAAFSPICQHPAFPRLSLKPQACGLREQLGNYFKLPHSTHLLKTKACKREKSRDFLVDMVVWHQKDATAMLVRMSISGRSTLLHIKHMQHFICSMWNTHAVSRKTTHMTDAFNTALQIAALHWTHIAPLSQGGKCKLYSK